MKDAAGSLAWIAILIVLGVVLARRGILSARVVAILRTLITTVTLPLLLFRAFLQLQPDGRNVLLALAVFAACGVMGVVGVLLSRLMRLPLPESRLLFQGFEAGMLGYALFIALHGSGRLPAFAAIDMGQVVYVFTVLLVQMSILSRRQVAAGSGLTGGAPGVGGDAPDAVPDGTGRGFPWRALLRSVVLWAIAAGLLLGWLVPDVARRLVAADHPASLVFETVGGLTTPLVCLVIGASLAGGIPRDRAIATIVGLRTAIGLGLGLVFGYLVVPALGFSAWHTRAAIMLFVLPAPFVIPVYYRRNPAFVGSVLTLSTLTSITLIAVLAVIGVI